MKRILFAIIFSSVGFLCFAQNKIKLEDVRKHVNENVIVEGKIFGIRYLPSLKNSPTYIDVGERYPKQLLTILFWGKTRSSLPYVPTETKDKGGIARVVGKIQLVGDKAEIIVSDPKQLEILTDVIIE